MHNMGHDKLREWCSHFQQKGRQWELIRSGAEGSWGRLGMLGDEECCRGFVEFVVTAGWRDPGGSWTALVQSKGNTEMGETNLGILP